MTNSRTFAYCRVSTTEQADSGLSLQAQAAAITASVGTAARLDVRTETGSGKNMTGRPVLNDLLDELDAEGGTLVVTRIDRLGRILLDVLNVADRAKRNGWRLRAIETNYDSADASGTGAILLAVMGAVAELERTMISERTKEALGAKRAQGHRFGKPILLAEATRQDIAARHAGGRSMNGIAADLQAEGVPTATGGRWHASTVRKVLGSLDRDRAAADMVAA